MICTYDNYMVIAGLPGQTQVATLVHHHPKVAISQFTIECQSLSVPFSDNIAI